MKAGENKARVEAAAVVVLPALGATLTYRQSCIKKSTMGCHGYFSGLFSVVRRDHI